MRLNAAPQGDDFGQSLLRIIMARSFQGESQIKESIIRDSHTGAVMPLAQAGVAAVGIIALLTGLGLLGWQAYWLLGWDLTPGDFLLLACMAFLLSAAAVAVVRVLASEFNSATVYLLAAGLVGLLIVGLLAALLSHREALTWWRAMFIVLGLALAIPGAALSYRQLVDLADPFGKTSPTERMMRPYLPMLFNQPEPETTFTRFVPYRAAGNGSGNSAKALSLGTGPLHPEDMALLEFAERAAEVGLSRRLWLGQTLESVGTPVTRDVYESLVDRLIHLGYVTPGGEGHAARWAVPASEAIGDLRTQAEMGEREE